ncbi:MAG: hypothetical protein JXR76_13695 [Deltaproteobacteria bacterium]|nr:hypothetical protein [Deltaproteobacteria bacterium]
MNAFDGLLAYVAFTVPSAIAIVAISFYRFRWSIPTRLFSMVSVIAITTGSAGHITGAMGTEYSWWYRIAMYSIFVPVIVMPAYYLYKLVVSEIRTQINQLVSGTSQISATTKQSAVIAAQQASIVNQVSSTVEEIHQMSSSTMMAAQKVLAITSSATEQGLGGQKSIEKAVSIMTLVGGVVEIVQTVEGLAEQSNLLALNASIEAAKAGEYGRGFSVVADEVRNLSKLSKAATKQIREAIQRVKEGQEAIDSSSETMQRLVAVLKKSSDSAREIYTAASEQVSEIQQLNESMTFVAQGGKNTADSVKELETALISLNGIASSLHFLTTGRNAMMKTS